ncbi:MAG TPA: YetF domain-containing protein [Opitutus sp.]|nr:YetF domain-containing protein [Opitutus sp.]
MQPVFRAFAVYLFLLVVFRAFGKRSLAQITTFDFVMLLIISETTQQALLGDDFSLTNCFLLVLTLVLLDTGLLVAKRRWPWFDRVTEGTPLVVLEHGRPLTERMRRARVDVADILAAARELQGLERLDQIRYAVLEKNGTITIIPAAT